jgi:Zn-dependent alcohol dehydrogenase
VAASPTAGGLGVHAVQIARMVGATPIIAVDPDASARARALTGGADHALDPDAGDVLFGVASQSLLGHLGYAKRHLDQLVELVAHRRLDVTRSISGTIPLEDVARGVQQLVTKEGNPIRLVAIP